MTAANARPPRRRKSAATTAVIVVSVVVVAAAVAAWIAQRGPAPVPSGFPGATLPTSAAKGPPPDFPVPATEAARLQALIAMLMQADQDDALWARDRLLDLLRRGEHQIGEFVHHDHDVG